MSPKPGSKEMLAVARGEAPADILIVGGKVFAPTTKEWIETSIAIKNGFVVGWGDREAHEIIDVKGSYISPGFIDGYVTMETSKLWIDSFVQTLLPKGTTAVALDPFQLSSVFGIYGIEELATAADKLPFTFGIYASSDAQSSQFDSTGEHVSAINIAELLRDFGAIGVGGLLHHSSVVNGEDDALAKIAAARGHRVVGHAPGLQGKQLDAYLTAGVYADVSALSYQEALEKHRKGLWLFLRNGTVRRNLETLLPIAIEYGSKNMAFSTDDRELETIQANGHINESIRIAVKAGLSPEDALIMASTNPAEFHGFTQLGYLSPGYQADIVVLPNLEDFEPSMVFQKGRLMARTGRIMVFSVPHIPPSPAMLEGVQVDLTKFGPDSLTFPAGEGQPAEIIAVNSDNFLAHTVEEPYSNADATLAKLGTLGRRSLAKDIAVGLIRGFGIREGAIATTVARGPHSLIVLGANSPSGSADMAEAVSKLIELGGGQIVVKDGKVISVVELPVGGIISTTAPAELLEQFNAINSAARSLGITFSDPFRRLELLALAVIPELRITNIGSINVLHLIENDPLQANPMNN